MLCLENKEFQIEIDYCTAYDWILDKYTGHMKHGNQKKRYSKTLQMVLTPISCSLSALSHTNYFYEKWN